MFEGESFELWLSHMTDALASRGLFEQTKSHETFPEVRPSIEKARAYFEWEQKDIKAKKLILSYVGEKIKEEFAAERTTMRLWQKLQESYGNSYAGETRSLFTSLTECWKPGVSITGRIRILAERIKELRDSDRINE